MEYFRFLLMEITLDIFSRLPTESVLDCKLVSRRWRSLVRHPTLSKLHLRRLSNSTSGKLSFLALTPPTANENEKFDYFEFDEINESTPVEKIRRINMTSPFRSTKIAGSCNGLICLFQSSHEVRMHCICNPVTREYVMLPDIQANHCETGFGYVSSMNEYKVVGVYVSEKPEVGIQIYTLGSGVGWRNLGDFNSMSATYPYGQPVFANGALYWMASQLEMIVTFNLAEEIFGELLAPPPLPLDCIWRRNTIGVLDGVLFFAIPLVVQGTECYDVWLLRKKNDDHEQGEEYRSFFWSKEFRVYDSALLALTKSDGVLCIWDKYLNFYDAEASTSKWLVDLKKTVVQVLPHKNTLVSLKELGEEDTKKMEPV